MNNTKKSDEERWDSAKLGYHVEIAKRARWITRAWSLTKLGEKIAQSKWSELSPAAQNVISRLIANDYPA